MFHRGVAFNSIKRELHQIWLGVLGELSKASREVMRSQPGKRDKGGKKRKSVIDRGKQQCHVTKAGRRMACSGKLLERVSKWDEV